MAQHAAIGRLSVFLGPTFSRTVSPQHADHIAFSSYCGIGANRSLYAAGKLDIVPFHLSQIPRLIEGGALRCDVVLMLLGKLSPDGKRNVAVSHDHLVAAAKQARVVIAEANDAAPCSFGAEEFSEVLVTEVVHTDRPVVSLPASAPSEAELKIAATIAGIVPDRAVFQNGIDAIPDAVLGALGQHRDLGVHSGMITDQVAALIEAGVVTNACKTVEPGVTVTGMLAGSQRLYAFADRNAQIRLRPVSFTHAIGITSRIERFFAINSAIETDLTGQVNSEAIGDDYVGAIGGQVDFCRGVIASPGGRSINALPSVAADGKRSRIVANLSSNIITTARSDADLVVTEWGVADLRGQPLAERARRMIAISHPDFRESLERAAWPGH